MATIECTVFWDMTSCSRVEVYCFRGTWINLYWTLQCQIQENSIFCNKVFQRNAFICKCQLQ
jgi:hypothetical protein